VWRRNTMIASIGNSSRRLAQRRTGSIPSEIPILTRTAWKQAPDDSQSNRFSVHPRRKNLNDFPVPPNRHFFARLSMSFECLGNTQPDSPVYSLRQIKCGGGFHRVARSMVRQISSLCNWICPPETKVATSGSPVLKSSNTHQLSAPVK
jgi:hypothetical protein